jgi:hypothetical protein
VSSIYLKRQDVRRARKSSKRSLDENRTQQFDLERPVLQLGNSGIWLTLGDLLESIQIIGGTGSGKSSSVGEQLADGMLRAGAGALFLTTKEDDARNYVALARRAGRAKDIVVMRLGGNIKVNIIEEAYRQGGTEDVVKVISVASAVIGGGRGAEGGDDRVWREAADIFIRNVVDALVGAGERLTLQSFAEFVASAPTTLESAADLRRVEQRLQSGEVSLRDLTCCERVWLKLGQNFRTGSIQLDPNTVEALRLYILREYPSLPDRTAGSIRFSLNTSIGALTRGAIADLCTKETTFALSELRRQKILILDIAPARFGEAGRAVETMLKHLVQKELERESVHPDSDVPPVLIFVDEASGYLTAADIGYQQKSRGARACSVLITQSLASYRLQLGSDATTALLEVMDGKFIFSCESETAEWASNLIGEDWDFEPTFSSGGGFTFSEQKRRLVEPIEFSHLARGGKKFGFKTECFFYKPGAKFGERGSNFLRVTCSQRRGK